MSTTTVTARESIPTAEVTLCCWCDSPATRNLDSYHDVACEAHHRKWFTGPDAAPLCDCRTCVRTRGAAARAAWVALIDATSPEN